MKTRVTIRLRENPFFDAIPPNRDRLGLHPFIRIRDEDPISGHTIFFEDNEVIDRFIEALTALREADPESPEAIKDELIKGVIR